MEFYHGVFGGKLQMNTFQEFHASQDPSEDNLIMSMSLSGDNEAELTGCFEKLSAGGQVSMPFQKAIWGDSFGMCIDRFGVPWLVNIAGQRA